MVILGLHTLEVQARNSIESHRRLHTAILQVIPSSGPGSSELKYLRDSDFFFFNTKYLSYEIMA